MSEQLIEHGLQLPDGSYANTVVPREVIDAMYPSRNEDTPIMLTRTISHKVDWEEVGINSTLRFQEQPDGRVAILGNTVPRLCPIAVDCGNCALAGAGLTVVEMSKLNCAKANTARALEVVIDEPEGRFMLTAVGSDAYIVDDSKITRETNGDKLMYNKLANASAVVFTASWLEHLGVNDFGFAINGADGSFGLATTVIDGELLFIPFCSMRENMGDRGEDRQILRKAINVYLDALEISEERRQEIIAGLEIDIDVSASATLRNFAHNIKIPRDDAEDERERQNAARIRARYPDLIERAGGKITSAIVLESEYPGALGRGSIFPQFEAETGIRTTPITPDNCPGDGQTCHVDYRAETEYALTTQLQAMGVSSARIYYNDTHALDPSAPSNNMASNRREQLNGVAVNKTNRTLNGMAFHYLRRGA